AFGTPPFVEYLTYTLTNVFISSFTTAEDPSGAFPFPQDTIRLHFGEVKESYASPAPLGTPNVADYNQATGQSVKAGTLSGPPLPAAPAMGLTFVQGGRPLPELAVQSYSWGAANPTGARPSLQDLTLTLAPGFVDPGLWGALAAGTHLPSATIHVRTTV